MLSNSFHPGTRLCAEETFDKIGRRHWMEKGVDGVGTLVRLEMGVNDRRLIRLPRRINDGIRDDAATFH